MSFTEKLWRRNLQIAEDRGTHTHTHTDHPVDDLVNAAIDGVVEMIKLRKEIDGDEKIKPLRNP